MNIDKYNNILKQTLALDENVDLYSLERGVTPDWDSVGHVALISALEEEFDVMFEIEDILKYKTYDQGIELLKGYGVSFTE